MFTPTFLLQKSRDVAGLKAQREIIEQREREVFVRACVEEYLFRSFQSDTFMFPLLLNLTPGKGINPVTSDHEPFTYDEVSEVVKRYIDSLNQEDKETELIISSSRAAYYCQCSESRKKDECKCAGYIALDAKEKIPTDRVMNHIGCNRPFCPKCPECHKCMVECGCDHS